MNILLTCGWRGGAPGEDSFRGFEASREQLVSGDENLQRYWMHSLGVSAAVRALPLCARLCGGGAVRNQERRPLPPGA